MKICFCSDIHGNGLAWHAFLRDVEKQHTDKIIFAGDILGYYYDAELILDEIRALSQKGKILSLLGNHDRMFLDLLENKQTEEWLVNKYGNSYLHIKDQISHDNVMYLSSLTSELKILTDGLHLGFFHGGPCDPLNMRIYPDTDLSNEQALDAFDYIFCGHTHHKMLKKFRNCTIINPGSLGQQRDGQGTSYVIFDTQNRTCQFHTFQYDIGKLAEQIEKRETNQNMKQRLLEVLYRKN